MTFDFAWSDPIRTDVKLKWSESDWIRSKDRPTQLSSAQSDLVGQSHLQLVIIIYVSLTNGGHKLELGDKEKQCLVLQVVVARSLSFHLSLSLIRGPIGLGLLLLVFWAHLATTKINKPDRPICLSFIQSFMSPFLSIWLGRRRQRRRL